MMKAAVRTTEMRIGKAMCCMCMCMGMMSMCCCCVQNASCEESFRPERMR